MTEHFSVSKGRFKVSLGLTLTGTHDPSQRAALTDELRERLVKAALSVLKNIGRSVESARIKDRACCGGDHCSQLWNLRCDDPKHRGVE